MLAKTTFFEHWHILSFTVETIRGEMHVSSHHKSKALYYHCLFKIFACCAIDCCDGSDEYDGRVQCKPTCLSDAGDALIEILPREAANVKGGSKEAAMRTSWKKSANSFSSKEEETDIASKPKCKLSFFTS